MSKKEAVQRDRFRVIAEVDENFVGRLLSVLSRLGVEDVSYELVTDVRTFHSNRAPRAEGPSAVDFGLAFIETNRTFTSKDLVRHFTQDGRTASAAYWAIRAMIDRRAISKMADNTYMVAPKQLPPPEKKAAPAEEMNGAKVATPAKAGTNRAAIIAFIASRNKGQTITTAELRELFTQQNRNVDSISPQVHKLIAEKRLKHDGDIRSGSYLVL